MSWIQQVERATFLSSLFRSSEGNERIVLHEFRVVRDGPSAWLRFDVNAAVDLFPEKWRMLGYNQAQVQLLATPIRSVRLNGFDITGNSEFHLEPTLAGQQIVIRSAESELHLTAVSVSVDKVTGYALDVT